MTDFLDFINYGPAFLMMMLGFCFLIIIHELGHFLAAKLVDMKVTQFALGMGPAIFSWRKGIGFRRGSTEPEYNSRLNAYFAEREPEQVKDVEIKTAADRKRTPKEIDAAARELGLGETEYRVNWVVLLGGYVKLLGQEDLKPEAVSDDERSFTRKPAWARAVVLSAGVFMNLVFGIILFVIAFTAGVKFPPAIVGDVMPHSPASDTYALGHEHDEAYRGLKPGDHIIKVDDDTTTDFTDITLGAALCKAGGALDLTVQRPGESSNLIYHVTPTILAGSRFLAIGIDSPTSCEVSFDPKNPPADLANVVSGSTATSVAGTAVERYDQLDNLISEAHGKPLPVTFTAPAAKGGGTVTVNLHAIPLIMADNDGHPSLLGLSPATIIRGVNKRSPADKAGVHPGDLIAQVDNHNWPQINEVSQIVHSRNGQPVNLIVQRDGNEMDLGPITPDSQGILGISLDMALDKPIISKVLPTSPLGTQNLIAGSQIVSVNGQPVDGFTTLARLLSEADDAPLKITFRNNFKDPDPVAVEVKLTSDQRKQMQDMVWTTEFLPFEQLRVPLAANNPVVAVGLGFKKTKQFMLQTYVTLFRLTQGSVPVSELHGVLFIAYEGTKIARIGWSYLLFFLGLISINLVVMNFLPIPILDGGQMLFLLLEKIKGSPVSIRVQEVLTYVGLSVIVCLLLVTFYYDGGYMIKHIFTGH